MSFKKYLEDSNEEKKINEAVGTEIYEVIEDAVHDIVERPYEAVALARKIINNLAMADYKIVKKDLADITSTPETRAEFEPMKQRARERQRKLSGYQGGMP